MLSFLGEALSYGFSEKDGMFSQPAGPLPPEEGDFFFGNNVFTTRHNHDMIFLLLQISNLTEEVSL